MKLEVTAYTGLEPGQHDVTVTSVEVKTSQRFGGEYLQWEFTADDGRSTRANTSVDMTPGNKTGKWFAALTGKATEVGDNRDTQEVIGRPAGINIVLDGNGYTKVDSLWARKATPKTRTATAEAVANAEGTAQAAKEHAAQEDELPF